jgi:hypothetical protein
MGLTASEDSYTLAIFLNCSNINYLLRVIYGSHSSTFSHILHKMVYKYLFRTLWSRSRDVVLVWWTIDMGCWEFGMGRDWGGVEEGEVSSRATWGQGGQDRTTQREGFQVSEKGSERESKGNQRETSKESKRWVCDISALSICICVYNNCLM